MTINHGAYALDRAAELPNDDLARREFISQATLAAVATVLAACSGGGDVTAPSGNQQVGSGGTTLTITLATFPTLSAVGGIAAVGSLGSKPIAVVRTAATTYLALSRVCTHANCTINVNATNFTCPCHGSRFNSTGQVTQGPATTALERFTATLSADGTTLTIS